MDRMDFLRSKTEGIVNDGSPTVIQNRIALNAAGASFRPAPVQIPGHLRTSNSVAQKVQKGSGIIDGSGTGNHKQYPRRSGSPASEFSLRSFVRHHLSMTFHHVFCGYK